METNSYKCYEPLLCLVRLAEWILGCSSDNHVMGPVKSDNCCKIQSLAMYIGKVRHQQKLLLTDKSFRPGLILWRTGIGSNGRTPMLGIVADKTSFWYTVCGNVKVDLNPNLALIYFRTCSTCSPIIKVAKHILFIIFTCQTIRVLFHYQH